MADETSNPDPATNDDVAGGDGAATSTPGVELDAEAALQDVAATVETMANEAAPFAIPDLADTADLVDEPTGINLLGDVTLRVKIELGRTLMYVEDVLRLNADSIVELDKAAGDPVDIFVNDRLVARGEVLVLNENFCVRVSEIVDAGSEGET